MGDAPFRVGDTVEHIYCPKLRLVVAARGDSRLRVAASQFEVPKPATDPRAWTGSEPSATPSSPRRHEPLSPDSGAGSTPNL